MSAVIGIDPSLTATGIATEHIYISIRPTGTGDDRLAFIADSLTEHIDPGVNQFAVIEDLPTHAHGAGKTGMIQGVIRLTLLNHGVDYVTVTAATLKKFATGKGNATKPDMRMALYQRAGLDVRDDNAVDAWWLRQIGLHLTDHPDRLELPKTHLAALDKISARTAQDRP